MPMTTFLTTVATLLAQDNATEHSYRPAVHTLLQTLIPTAHVTNEPRPESYGAPDFVLQQGQVIIGHIEMKTIGVNLDKAIADSERELPKTPNGIQLRRYRAALPNLLYTDGLVWHWFVDGVSRLDAPVRIARWERTTHHLTPNNQAFLELNALLEHFATHHSKHVGSPTDLAQRLAHVARWLAEVITTVLTTETHQGALHHQLEAFQVTLLPNLAPAEFADMYAQTLVYGLFAARLVTPNTDHFSRLDAAQAIPKTNPFLRKMFHQIAGFDLDERIAWLVDDCAHLLEHTDMAEVLRDFGKATQQEDPMVHFYETFLAAYDPKTREMRGVYYTPEPVVSYIVRSVDHLLQTQFGKPLGLADGDTVILDPATGTATFLHAVVQHIYGTLQSLGMADTWNKYVPEQLLPRLFGFELLMAPYTIAHLKVSILLQQLGYTFGSNERLGIYLTNTLSDVPTGQHIMPFAQFIADEGKAADAIKHKKPVMVVLGNPPYSYESINTGQWIGQLVREYYRIDGEPLGERNPKGLQDDYVKFIRFGQYRITQTGEGILAFISNHGYLDNPTFRGMREQLLREFDTLYFVNLHGNSRKKEQTPDGTVDENVFDIQQGVTIGIFVKHQPGKQGKGKRKEKTGHATVYYADMWGKRTGKYTRLLAEDVSTTPWQHLDPVSPWYLFVPFNRAILPEYEQGAKITDIMPVHSLGIMTARDHLTIQWTRQMMLEVLHKFSALDVEDAREHYQLGDDVRDWKVAYAQHDVQHAESEIDEEKIVPIFYRLFDRRYTYYTGHTRGFLCMPRFGVMQHMLQENIALLTCRQLSFPGFRHVFCADTITECSAVSLKTKEGTYVLPLYLYPNGKMPAMLFDHENGRRPNFSAAFIANVEQQLGLAFIPDGTGDLTSTVGPEDVFHYLYAMLYSPTYRTRYAEFLKIDFPRVAISNDKAIFQMLASYGAMLVDLHLLRVPGSSGVGGAGGAAVLARPSDQGVMQQGVTQGVVEQITYEAHTQRVVIGGERFFGGIDATTWAMEVGGYHPLHKWLKDRRGRTLSFDEALHYMRMVVALRETQQVMAAIDEITQTSNMG